jgi:thiol-disulfide isomerase/thioredoxin
MRSPKRYPNGIAAPILVVIIALLVLVVGGAVYVVSTRPAASPASPAGDAMMEKEEAGTMEKEDGATMEKKEGGEEMARAEAPVSFSGARLAGGTRSPLLDFSKADYDRAVASGKLVALYFYANWCPICKAEFPKMQVAFNQLATENVIGFRVNYNDNETDDVERDLARQFGVAYQHTKVFFRGSERLSKSPESWETDRYLEEIRKYQ